MVHPSLSGSVDAATKKVVGNAGTTSGGGVMQQQQRLLSTHHQSSSVDGVVGTPTTTTTSPQAQQDSIAFYATPCEIGVVLGVLVFATAAGMYFVVENGKAEIDKIFDMRQRELTKVFQHLEEQMDKKQKHILMVSKFQLDALERKLDGTIAAHQRDKEDSPIVVHNKENNINSANKKSK